MKKLTLAALFAAILVSGCGPKEEGHAHEEGPRPEAEHREGFVELTPEQRKVAGIETVIVGERSLRETLDVPGTVGSTSKGRAVVTPPVEGRIVDITASLGDRVRAGQVLATLDSAALAQTWSGIASSERDRDAATASLREAKAEVELAAAKLNSARTDLQRQREFAKAGAFSQAPLQQAQGELNDAQSELLSAQKEQAGHAELVRRLERLFRDGIVSKADLDAAKLELQQDEIKLERADARIAAAKTTYEREKNIASRGLLNAKELQTAEAGVRAAELELQRARVRVKSAEAAVRNAQRAIANERSVYRANSGGGAARIGRVELIAPIAGIVTHLDLTKGQAVDRAQVLMEIENLETVWVTANLPERDAGHIRKGLEVEIEVAAFAGRKFRGVVDSVGDRVDPKTRAVPIRCLVEAKGTLKPEMFATVHLALGGRVSGLAVPDTAILTENGKSFVFVASGDDFEKREVRLGGRSYAYTIIESGLSKGEMIVTKGAFVLNSELGKADLKGHEH